MSAPWIVLIVVLWLVVIGETVLVLGLSRRLTALEMTRGPVDHAHDATMGALAPGNPVPREVADQLGSVPADTSDGSSVILFLSPGCGPCMKLADELAEPSREGHIEEDVEIVVVTNQAGAERFGHIGRTVIDTSATIARGFRVPGTPFGFAVDSKGIIRGVAVPNDADDLRHLADVHRQPALG